MSWARGAPSHLSQSGSRLKKSADESLFPPGSMEEEVDLSMADLSTDSSEWSESDGEDDYDPFLGPRADGAGLPLTLDDSKRKFSSPTAACGSTSPSMRIRKEHKQPVASCPAQLCNVPAGKEVASGPSQALLDTETVRLRPGVRKRRKAKDNSTHSKAPCVPSLDEIASVDITNDDAYNRILSNIARQRTGSGSSALAHKLSKAALPPHASNWAAATRTADSPRRRPQASPLGAARLASASARLCAIENAVLGLDGVAHMHEFLEKKRECFVKESAKWQAHLKATQQKKHDLVQELQARCDENTKLHQELQEQGLDRALTLLEKLLANVKRVTTSVRDRVEAPGSDIALHYAKHAEGPHTFRMDAVTDISGSVGRAAAAFARSQPVVRRMGRTASVSLFSSAEIGVKQRFKMDAPAVSMSSSSVSSMVKAQSSQALDDAIVCILSTVEALRSAYCVSDLLENDSKIEWFPFADMEQTNDELESALKSIASENKTLKESLDLSKAAASNLERMCEDADSIAAAHAKLSIAPAQASVDVLRASRSLKVTSSLLSMQAQLEATFPNTNSHDTSQVEWSNDKGEAHLKNASLDSLLSMVTSSSDSSNAYLMGIKRTFFLTFRYFLTIPELLEKLVLRFCMCPPQTIPSQTSQADYSGMERDRSNIQQPDRDGIMGVIHHWVEEWFDLDFRHDKDNLDMLRAFLRNTAAKCGSFAAAERTELLISRLLLQTPGELLAGENPVEDDGADLSSLGAEMGALEAMKITSFMDISPKDLAEQLTLLESKQYRCIQPCELLCQAWNKKEKEVKAPNLQQTFLHFNSVSALFVSAILAEAEVEARASVIRHVLVVGMHFLRLNNYNGVIEVVSALQSSAVERLWLTWNYLGKHIYAAKQLLCTITANNMQTFRHLWKAGGCPSVPYVGVFLTDLTFLEDGNPTWSDGGCTLVNMFKFRMIEHTISVLLSSQGQEDYAIEADPAVQAFCVDLLKTAPAVTEDAWYRMSLSLESREASKQAAHYSIKYDFETLQEAVSALVSLRTHPLLDGEDITLADDDVELAGQAHITTRESSENRLRSNAVLEVKFTPLELDNIASRMRAAAGGVLRKDRRFRMKVYHEAFLGNDAVDWLISHEAKLTSRAAAAKLGKMLTKLHYIRHVTNDHSFKDKPQIYQFVENVSRPRGRS